MSKSAGSNSNNLTGTSSSDTIYAGNGEDTVNGGAGNDIIDGGNGDDVLDGGSGNDTIDGGNGDDAVDGGSGNDTIDGGNGDDAVDGGSGNDIIDGGNGDDVLDGGSGNDIIDGGNGDDVLDGGSGNDLLSGGNGSDVFIYNVAENINALDNYDGGGGSDTVNIIFTSAIREQLASTLGYANSASYLLALTNYFNQSAAGSTLNFNAFGFDLTITKIEKMTLSVTQSNAPSVAPNTITINEDISHVFQAGDFGFSDSDLGDTLVAVKFTNLPQDGQLLLNGILVTADQVITIQDINEGKLLFTPDANENGTNYAQLTFQASDGVLWSNSANFTFNVSEKNDVPSTNDGTVPLMEDNILSGQLTGTDVDGDNLTYSLVNQAEHGIVNINDDGSYTYTPHADYFGNDSFEYKVDDGNGGVDTAIITLDIKSVNDAPTFNLSSNSELIVAVANAEQTIEGYASGMTAGANEGSQQVSFTVTVDQPDWFVEVPTIDPVTGDLHFKALPGFEGTVVATVTLSDDGGTSNNGVNVSTAKTFVMKIDTKAPDAPTMLDLLDTSDSGQIATDNITSFNQPTLQGIAEVGSRVELFLNGVLLGETITDEAGQWLFTPATNLADGSYEITARAVDSFGNIGATSSVLPLIIDTAIDTLSAPTLDPASDDGDSSTDGITTITTPSFKGTTEANAQVELYSNETLLGTTQADALGNWSIVTSPLSIGNYSVFTKVTDLAGNTSTSPTSDVNIISAEQGNALFTSGNNIVDFALLAANQYDPAIYYNALSGNDTVYLPNGAQSVTLNYDPTVGFQDGLGSDRIFGSDLNDLFLPTTAIAGHDDHDLFVGGDGIDTISYQLVSGSVSVVLWNSFTEQQTGGAGWQLLRNIENVVGTDFNDSIIGSTDINYLHGGLGNDDLDGYNGDDILNGGAGDDVIDGGAGIDTLEFDDTVQGAFVQLETSLVPGNNTINIIGVSSSDGAGTDTLLNIENVRGTAYSDTVFGSSVRNVIFGMDGDDIIEGAGGNDRLLGGEGNDAIYGGNEDDVLIGGEGDDYLYGDDGSDYVSYEYSQQAVTVQLNFNLATGEGTDYLHGIENIIGSNYDDILIGNEANNTFVWYGGKDYIDGGEGNDTVSYIYRNGVEVFLTDASSNPNQTVFEGEGDTLFNIENITGSSYDDQLFGNSEDNILDDGGGGDDTINGGAGNDTVSYLYALGAVTINLINDFDSVLVNTGGSGYDYLTSIENIRGSAFNDTLSGNDQDNIIEGGLGSDVLDGEEGNDTASYALSGVGVKVDLNLQGSYQETFGAGTDKLLNFENLIGSNFNDELVGDETDNVLSGLLGSNVLDGGAGKDTTSYKMASAGVVVDLAITDYQDTVGAGNDKLIDIENIRGSAFNDTLQGNALDNTLDGDDGDDTINGMDGDDVLIGGKGNNSLDGGAGIDTANYSFYSTVFFAGLNINLSQGYATALVGDLALPVNDQLTNIENVVGSAYDDTITGDANDNVLSGGSGGYDILDGGLGNDTASFKEATDRVSLDLGIDNSFVSLINIENATGSKFNDLLVGDDNNNVLNGYLGDDILEGKEGDDVLIGDAGSDWLEGGHGDDQLAGGADNDNLFGDWGNDALYGGEGNDVLRGGEGDDYLAGGFGYDQIFGDDGLDTISYLGVNYGVSIYLAELPQAPGSTYVKDPDSIYDLFQKDEFYFIENAEGSHYADNIVGNAGHNTLIGRDGDDRIFGGDGDDLLDGGDDNDTLDAGEGNDIIYGGDGDDSLFGGGGHDLLSAGSGINTLDGGAGSDTVSYAFAASGVSVILPSLLNEQIINYNDNDTIIDTLINIENLIGSDFDDDLIGADTDNILEGGNGNDVINGYQGFDTASYRYASSAVTVNLVVLGQAQNTEGAGVDILFDIENLMGSTFDDYLRGNLGNNVLEGLVGNDYLDGDEGIDSASYALATSYVHVNLMLQGAGQDTLGAGIDILNNFENIIGSAYADRLVGDSNNNAIYGGNGADWINGGDGNDLLAGDGGDDFINGDAGFNIASYSSVLSGVTVSLKLLGMNQDTLGAGIDYLVNIQGVEGSAYNDSLQGNNGNNYFEDRGGNDYVNGDLGIDTVSYALSSSSVNINLNLTTQQDNQGGGQDQLVSIENIIGSNFGDVLIGDGVGNVLNGGAGIDVLDGGDGDDNLIGDSQDMIFGGMGNDTFSISSGSGFLDLGGLVAMGKLSGIERINLNNTEGETADTVMVDKGAVINMSAETNTLYVNGSSSDVLNIGPGWQKMQMAVSDNYAEVTHSYDAWSQDNAMLYIEQGIIVNEVF